MPETDWFRNAQTIVDGANVLARTFYRRMGYQRPEGYRFDRATHPREQMCWRMAADAYEQFFGTELGEVLDELNEA